MQLIVNNTAKRISFRQALETLLEGAEGIDVAVSYVQNSGWQILKSRVRDFPEKKYIRIICTDQMSITHPAAIKDAMKSGVSIRNFSEKNKTYHPKVYLAFDKNRKPIRFLVGSSNLSESAFKNSIEAGILGDHPEILSQLTEWFEDLYCNSSSEITPTDLTRMEHIWRGIASLRLRARLLAKRATTSKPIPASAADDVEVVEDVFATIQAPITLLNFDHARNNIRTISQARKVLETFADGDQISGKQKSELKLLGFLEGGRLNSVGVQAAKAASDDDFALIWCKWLANCSSEFLMQINTRLIKSREVFTKFWRLNIEVQKFFLDNIENKKEREVLKTIELLCNANDFVERFSLNEFRTLAPMLKKLDDIPSYIRKEVREYLQNKGTRGWDRIDRKIILEAWKKISRR